MVLAGFCTNWRQWKCALISGAYAQNTWSIFLVVKVSQVEAEKNWLAKIDKNENREESHNASYVPLFLSLAFQKEKVDLVSAMCAITKTNGHLALFEKKPFAKLPHVKHLLSKCNQVDGENYYQNWWWKLLPKCWTL